MTPAEILDAWHRAAQAMVPDGTAVWDAHTHTGQHDPDGRHAEAEELLEMLERAGHAGAVVMSNANPEGYLDANDRILEEAQASGGRLIPFCRVDPNDGPGAVREIQRSLGRGHKGIKLHPRAEAFRMDDPGVDPIAQEAAERGVPILIHAGRGIPALGKAVTAHLECIEGLSIVLAHCGISDLSHLGPIAHEIPGLYFDTAWWDITDRLALHAWVPPERIMYASDTPYGWPELSFTLTVRASLAEGYAGQQLTDLLGGTLQGLLAGPGSEHLSRPQRTETAASDVGLLRVHASIHGAIVAAFSGVNFEEPLSLARLACEVPSEARHHDVYRAIRSTLAAIDPFSTERRVVFGLLVMAAAAALTPDIPVPELP